MQFNRDEYALLSRRGSVPVAVRSGSRPVSEADWGPRRARPARVRTMVIAAAQGLRETGRRRVGSAHALSRGVRATWTAFGRGGGDQFRGR